MANIIYDALFSGLESVLDYLSAHVLTCLIPAFFIAGAIGAFIKKDAILLYFGPKVNKWKSYGIASVSGAILAVCSCTILPLFAGIYKKGSGIGPATAFLYAGPAINVLAIVYTARVLGYDLGAARAVSAIGMSFLVGFIMAKVFRSHDEKNVAANQVPESSNGITDKPLWVFYGFFTLMVLILIIGAAQIDWIIKIIFLIILIAGLLAIVNFYYQRDELEDWGYETWDLTKKIFPFLIFGTFVVGLIAYFLPPETFSPYLGSNSILDCFTGAVIGAILYMPTLLEVPIIGTTFGYSSGLMGQGPALALLLAGPAVSLPNMIVLYQIIGAKKTIVYIWLVIIFSTVAGFFYGLIFV
jgi:uncharacterized membrane protein YraQ (UPF0718 family)